MKALQVELITPEGKIYHGEAESVQIPGFEGLFQVLYDHAPLISALSKGLVTIVSPDKKSTQYNIEGGVAEVLNNQVIILAEKVIK